MACTGSELRILRNPAHGFSAGEGALAIFVPAIVELAFVLVGPLFKNLVRTVCGPGCPVHKERLIRLVGILFAKPLDGILRDVLGEVVALGLLFGDLGSVARQGRFVLRSLASKESVEILEPITGRPIIKRPLRGDLVFGSVVPLAPRRRCCNRNP